MADLNKDEEDEFGVPLVLTARWMREHIAELQCSEAAAALEFTQYLAAHPNPKGEQYQRAYRMRQRREGFRGLIERHTVTLRCLEASEAQVKNQQQHP